MTTHIAQFSCGTEWSGVQKELEECAKECGMEVVFPVASLDEIEEAQDYFNFSPRSDMLKVMLGQALTFQKNAALFDGAIILTCFRCAEGVLTKRVVSNFIEEELHLPVVTYSFTERTMKRNMRLRLEALNDIAVQKNLPLLYKHQGRTLGIDSGSTSTKAALLEEGEVVKTAWVKTTDHLSASNKAVEEVLEGKSISEVDAIGVTGYGRLQLKEAFNANFSQEEITVCAAGASYLADVTEGKSMVIDIGGTDSKAITLNDGLPDSFTIGGVCAGASGRFLEVTAARLGVSLTELGEMALRGNPAEIMMNAYCIVFGMQDLSGALAEGEKPEDVAAAACQSVAEQYFEQQLREIEVREPLIVVGGTSLNKGLVQALGKITGFTPIVPPYSVYAGAVGAALFANALKRR